MKKYNWYLANLITYPLFVKNKKILNSNYYMFWDNLVLIKATSSTEAYSKAFKAGKQYEVKYTNPEGEKVNWKFAGIRELVKIYNKLVDGEELAY